MISLGDKPVCHGPSYTGVSVQAIEDALAVCALFNIIDRVTDALDVTIPSVEGFARTAERLLEQG